MNRVLVVDDDPDLLHFVALSLTAAGFETAIAGSGPEALERLSDKRFDCLVLDLMMPGMSGADVIVEMRKRKLEVPVIITSATPDIDGIMTSLGIVEWFQKPYDLKLLHRRIHQVTLANAVVRGRLQERARPLMNGRRRSRLIG
jgi:DNA-binding response OmpR family regulator